jgi:hypothetical protein
VILVRVLHVLRVPIEIRKGPILKGALRLLEAVDGDGRRGIGRGHGAEEQRNTSPAGFYLAVEFPRPPERLGALSWHLSRV